MCLIALAYKVRDDYPFVFVANRDEYYARPTRAAAFWPDRPALLAGKDLLEGGTWCGITRTGRFAAVTNYREARAVRTDTRSRGLLTRDFLLSRFSIDGFARALSLNEYQGFNLLFGTIADLAYLSNRAPGPKRLTPGVYGLSNGVLNEAWPKVVAVREGLQRIVGERCIDPQALFALLQDGTPADEEQLPETGIPIEWEHLLSSRYIESPEYGTRSTTLLVVDGSGQVSFQEVSYPRGQSGDAEDCVSYRFTLGS
jgi:uncharacterized protein with NRDE domain